jgi:hypothetical protein
VHEVFTVEEHLSALNRLQSGEGPGEGAFTGDILANEAQRLPPIQIEGKIFDGAEEVQRCAQPVGLSREPDAEVADFEEDVGGVGVLDCAAGWV